MDVMRAAPREANTKAGAEAAGRGITACLTRDNMVVVDYGEGAVSEEIFLGVGPRTHVVSEPGCGTPAYPTSCRVTGCAGGSCRGAGLLKHRLLVYLHYLIFFCFNLMVSSSTNMPLPL